MGGCIAIVSDMIFATRITGTADKLGAKCKIVKAPARCMMRWHRKIRERCSLP